MARRSSNPVPTEVHLDTGRRWFSNQELELAFPGGSKNGGPGTPYRLDFYWNQSELLQRYSCQQAVLRQGYCVPPVELEQLTHLKLGSTRDGQGHEVKQVGT
eukprot:6025470-Amphidinium_carterae.1